MAMAGGGGGELPANISDDITPACKIGTELGAHVRKTQYSVNMDGFRVHEVLQADASGVIFGRQICQDGDPAEAVAAVSQLVHGGTRVGEAEAAVVE